MGAAASDRTGAARSRLAVAAAREAAGARARRACRTRAAGPPVFPGARFAHRQRPAVENLPVEFLDRLLGLRAVEELDERESPRPAGVAVDRQHHV